MTFIVNWTLWKANYMKKETAGSSSATGVDATHVRDALLIQAVWPADVLMGIFSLFFMFHRFNTGRLIINENNCLKLNWSVISYLVFGTVQIKQMSAVTGYLLFIWWWTAQSKLSHSVAASTFGVILWLRVTKDYLYGFI